MPTIKSAGIISKPRSDAAARIVPELIHWLQERGISVRMDAETAMTPSAFAYAVRSTQELAW